MKTGKTFIISGPSGVGKSTVLRELLRDRDDLYFSISATTRTAGEKSIPWCYWNERCMRPLIAMAESTGWKMPGRSGKETIAHTALGDAVYQAKVVSEIWQRFTTPFLNI